MANKSQIDGVRAKIDQVDKKLINLINERASLATTIAEIKRTDENNDSFYRPEREAMLLRKIMEQNEGPCSDEDITRLFREIMSVCLAMEEVLNIAYLGPEGTFTQSAALKHFGHSVKTSALPTIDQVFSEVETGACQYGVVPIENSIEGVVNHTLDMLINSSLMICGEVEVRIHQHLMGKSTEIDAIRRIFSHQQSFAQCRRWLDTHYLQVKQVAVNSNAEAAKLASENIDTAAIAGDSAADFYGLKILIKNIEDESDNTTRFLILGRRDTPATGNDKTSLIFSTPNLPGALQKMLSYFSENNVSMTRIESRPSRRGMWDYVFFVDIEGHATDDKVAKALNQLKQHASMVKLLGSYPRAVL